MSFVLALADTLQEFARHGARFAHADYSHVLLEYGCGCSGVNLRMTPPDKLTVTFEFARGEYGTYQHKKDKIAKEQRLLFDKDYGFFDIAPIGLREVEMLAVLLPS